jgi:hypothetical protein
MLISANGPSRCFLAYQNSDNCPVSEGWIDEHCGNSVAFPSGDVGTRSNVNVSDSGTPISSLSIDVHYAELEAMPSEPPAPPESAPPPPVKAAVQLPLF